MLALKIRLAKEFHVLPSEIGRRLTAKDVAQILAFEQIQDEMMREAGRNAELQNQAAQQRKKALK